MNHLFKICVLSGVLLIFGCKKETEKPKVIYESNKKPEQAAKKDSTALVIADLPIHMEGTGFLLFPVGEYRLADNSEYASSRGGSLNYKVSNYSEYQISGFIRNIKFQQIGKDTIYALTDKSINIQSVTYLKNIADRSKQQLLVYVLEDMDTNKDVKLDDSDIHSLYLSEISGGRFTKVSTDFQELIDWNVVESMNRLYYRTTEDTNKNGAFDKDDMLHYYFVDLADKAWKSIEYKPL